MRKLIQTAVALVLTLTLLTTPAYALDWNAVKSDLFNELFTEEQWQTIMENEHIQALLENEKVQELLKDETFKKQVEQMMEDLDSVIDEIRGMSDEELRQTIIAMAKQYNIPELNDEQLDFLVSLCRGLEKADDIGNTVEGYGEKLSAFRQTMGKVKDAIGGIWEKLGGMFEGLSGLLSSREQAP